MSDFMSAGYDDVWSRALSEDRAGLTCCQDEADNNPVSQLYQRIDLASNTRQSDSVGSIVDWGRIRRSRLPDGLWPSDHAAVVAGVVVGSS
jgi:hypothetical protein